MITFVVFLCKIPEKTLQSIMEKIGRDPSEPVFLRSQVCLAYLYQSAKFYHPDCQFVVITDKHSQLQVPSGVELIRYDVDLATFILSRANAYARFLSELRPSNVIFLDPDMLIQGNLDEIFKKDFDLGLTFVSLKESRNIISGALIFVREGSQEKAREYFLEKIEIIKSSHVENHVWGDQKAIHNYFKSKSIQYISKLIENAMQETLIDVDGLKILLLPGYRYNWTFSTQINHNSPPLIAHFKGPRKQFIEAYVQAFYPHISRMMQQ